MASRWPPVRAWCASRASKRTDAVRKRRRRGRVRRGSAPAIASPRESEDQSVKVLITGGAGFVGSHLAEAFLDRGDEVTVFDLASDVKVRHLRDRAGFRMIRESVLKTDILEGVVAWADLVYHLAAVVGAEHYEGAPYRVSTVTITGPSPALAA